MTTPDASTPASEPPVSRVVVLDAVLPEVLDVRRVEVRRIRMAAGVAAGPHVHNGPVLGVVLEGSVHFQVDGGEAAVLGPGDVFYEPAGTRIEHFDAMDQAVTFLGYFPLTEGQEPELRPLD